MKKKPRQQKRRPIPIPKGKERKGWDTSKVKLTRGWR